jgi:phospholipid-binding lipoprotein MlaA
VDGQPGEGREVWFLRGLLAIGLFALVGCASVSGGSASSEPAPEDQVEVLLSSLHTGSTDEPRVAPSPQPESLPTPPQALTVAQETPPAPAEPPAAAKADAPAPEKGLAEDPFAGQIPEEEEEYDPWEPFNVKVFEFNRNLDKYVLKPVAKAYNRVVPDALQRGVRNAFINIRFVPRLLNNLFQGKVKGVGLEASRFLINSTAGVGGFIDVAKRLGLETPREDFGQTLGVYGVKPGPYLLIPFLPPYTVRDFGGFVFDLFLDPLNFFVFPIIEIDGAPRLITNRDTAIFGQFGTRVGEIVNDRSLNLEKFQGVEEATLDLYGAVRNAYLQSRTKAIKE